MAGGEPRFGMLETIREYALERLAERGDGEAVRRRHAGFYALARRGGRAGLLGPQQLSWLERLDAELANIRACADLGGREREAEVGLRIGAALWRYWQLRGSNTEGRERLERLLAGRSGSEAARAKAQCADAHPRQSAGRPRGGVPLVEASLPVHRAARRRPGRSRSHLASWLVGSGAG